jgi:catechol 2,3-dioxygenase-like lactoylglutathione lyase family enzyme
MNAAPALSRIGQIAVNVHDLDRAVAFYRDCLALPFLFQAPGMAFFRCGDVVVMLGLPSAPEFDHPASILYFEVQDIAATHQALAGRGVTFRSKPHVAHREPEREMRLAFFQDTEGNTLALMSWTRPG